VTIRVRADAVSASLNSGGTVIHMPNVSFSREPFDAEKYIAVPLAWIEKR